MVRVQILSEALCMDIFGTYLYYNKNVSYVDVIKDFLKVINLKLYEYLVR